MTVRAGRPPVAPFLAMDMMRLAHEREAAGETVLHLEIGQPGTPAPQPVLEAAARALKTSRIGYTDALGIAPLRQAIAGHCRSVYGLDLPAGRVAVTTFASNVSRVQTVAKVAAASVDDVAAAAGKAGAKTAGVIIDDAAVTPKYLQGFAVQQQKTGDSSELGGGGVGN